jgi:hypothetical protein
LKAVVSDFDPELHLRLMGEQALLSPRQTQGGDPRNNPLVEIAAALVAIGALNQERAQCIIDDYGLAFGLRGRGQMFGFRLPGHGSRGSRQPLKAPRVVVCEMSFDQPWGKLQVHYAALGDRATTLCITAFSPGGLKKLMHQRGSSQLPSLTDDRGQTEVAHISGGGGTDGEFRGRLSTMHPLAQDTKWLDVGSDRVDLVGESKPPRVEIETIPDRRPAERFLWGRLSAGRHGPHHLGSRPVAIDATIETLVAAGAIAPDSDVIYEVRDVLAAFSGQQPQGVIPEPWASLLAGIARQGEHSGILGLGVVTPPFDDTIVSLEALTIKNGNFEVHLAISPDSAAQMEPMSSPVRGTGIEWWAEDDLGNSYLGAIGNWGGGGDIGEGTITYWPALDPQARVLRIMPTGSKDRAVVSVELPRPEERI